MRRVLYDPDSWARLPDRRGPQWRLDPDAALRTIRLRYPQALVVFGEAVLRAAAPVPKPDAPSPCKWCELRERGGDPPPTDEANRTLLGDPCPACQGWLLNAAVERVHPGRRGCGRVILLTARSHGRANRHEPARRPPSRADLITMRRLGIVASAFAGHRPASVIEREQRRLRVTRERRARGLKLAGQVIDQERRHKAIIDAAYELEIRERAR